MSGAAVAWHESVGVVCPRCRGALATRADAFDCERCRVHYPIVLGIADFRLEADPWIGLEDDREKARRLETSSRGASLEAMVRTYWAMTPGTPVEQASRFLQHVMSAGTRSSEWVERLDPPGGRPSGSWLDVGTGTGDLACAVAERGVRAVGIDVAMRWLVVARRGGERGGAEGDVK